MNRFIVKEDRIARAATDWQRFFPWPLFGIKSEMRKRINMIECAKPVRARDDMQRAVLQIGIDRVIEYSNWPLKAMFEVCRILMQILWMPTDRLFIEALAFHKQFNIGPDNRFDNI